MKYLVTVLLLLSAAAGQGTAPESHTNPFGLMLPWAWQQPEKAAQFADQMQVNSYRPLSVFLDRPMVCAECLTAKQHELDIVMVVRANGEGNTQPTKPPGDVTAFKKRIQEVGTKWQPLVVVIENEPNSPLFYDGTADQYLAELKAGCEASHAVSIPCADGGMASKIVVALTIKGYLDSGRTAAAVSLARRTLSPQIATPAQVERVLQRFSAPLAFAGRLLNGFAGTGADYVNFHWYESDPGALKEVADYLKNATGLPVITTEIGQRTDDPGETRAKLQEITDLGLELAVWFSNDSQDGHARALADADGKLRPTGLAFQQFMAQHYAERASK